MQSLNRARAGSQQGFSLPEVLIVITVIAILAGVAVGVTPSIIAFAKGESAMRQVTKVLQTARETALTRRRNIEVRFQAPSTIEIAQVDVPGPGTTVLETVQLEGGSEYFRISALGDTPDDSGRGTAAIVVNSIAPNAPIMFTSEGTFVDTNGDPVNVSAFFAINEQASTATAVTIFGVSAVVNAWRWNGTEWVK